ncbi:MAG: hypothetical protein WCV93_05590 [Candidatus Shapirobacteria bacterium]|jgi:hypothetical protein
MVHTAIWVVAGATLLVVALYASIPLNLPLTRETLKNLMVYTTTYNMI